MRTASAICPASRSERRRAGARDDAAARHDLWQPAQFSVNALARGEVAAPGSGLGIGGPAERGDVRDERRALGRTTRPARAPAPRRRVERHPPGREVEVRRRRARAVEVGPAPRDAARRRTRGRWSSPRRTAAGRSRPARPSRRARSLFTRTSARLTARPRTGAAPGRTRRSPSAGPRPPAAWSRRAEARRRHDCDRSNPPRERRGRRSRAGPGRRRHGRTTSREYELRQERVRSLRGPEQRRRAAATPSVAQ